jgi:hypothetical protein
MLIKMQTTFAGALPLRAQVHISDIIMRSQERLVELIEQIKDAQEKDRQSAEQLYRLQLEKSEAQTIQSSGSSKFKADTTSTIEVNQ